MKEFLSWVSSKVSILLIYVIKAICKIIGWNYSASLAYNSCCPCLCHWRNLLLFSQIVLFVKLNVMVPPERLHISDENVTVSLCIHLFIEGLGITKRYVAQFYQYYGSLVMWSLVEIYGAASQIKYVFCYQNRSARGIGKATGKFFVTLNIKLCVIAR